MCVRARRYARSCMPVPLPRVDSELGPSGIKASLCQAVSIIHDTASNKATTQHTNKNFLASCAPKIIKQIYVKMEYTSKTQIYQKVKKPLLERQRRARINKCLDTLKTLVAELRGDDGILRMDKAEMLESAVVFMRQQKTNKLVAKPAAAPEVPLESFRNGYMNAVNEVSRVMASTPGMSVDLGKSVMTHLGRIYKNLQQFHEAQTMCDSETTTELSINCTTAPLSPASSGYHSDCESPAPSPMPMPAEEEKLWRPW